MVPIFPHKPTHQQVNSSAHAPAAREQEFYDRHGSNSIVGFYHFIQAVSALLGAPAMMAHRLSGERFRQYRVALRRFERKHITHGVSDG